MIDTRVTAALAEIGITHYGAVPVSEIVFSESFAYINGPDTVSYVGLILH